MNYNKEMYVGKRVRLYPGNIHLKYGVIESVDDLGWMIRITDSKADNWKVGNTYFISHSKGVVFEIL